MERPVLPRDQAVAILGRPGIRLAAMALSAILVVTALSNLAVGVTFGFNFDELPQNAANGEGGLPEGMVPPPGDYSELIKQYDGEIPPYASGGEGGDGSGSGSGGDPPPGGEPPPEGTPPDGGSGSGSGEGESPFPDEIPQGAAEAIRPGAGENSVGDLSNLPDGGDGFGSADLFSGFGDFMANPMDPKTFLIILGVIIGGIAAFVGVRYLMAWLRQREEGAQDVTTSDGRRLKPRPLPKDARMAVLIAYETFTIHAHRHGVQYGRHETPREFARRAVSAKLVPREPALRLTDLYEEARLSTHTIPAKHRAGAVDCLKKMAAAPASG